MSGNRPTRHRLQAGMADPTLVAMRFAYADPPYLGCCRRYAHHHPDGRCWDDLDTHRALIDQLTADYPDGWALSLSAKSLPAIVRLCPADVRVCSWVKPFAAFKKHVRVAYTWEPVIIAGGRRLSDPDAPVCRDHLIANMTLRTGQVGAKPQLFNRWILDLLGYLDDVDTMTDLYPGSAGMAAAVDAPRLFNRW